MRPIMQRIKDFNVMELDLTWLNAVSKQRAV